MAANNSDNDVRRKFNEIVGPQIDPAMADTLVTFLRASAGQYASSDSSVTYVLNRLWRDRAEGAEGDTQ